MATRKPILISGAGIASLLLAQSLRRASIPFIVFERDKSISFRAQGYRLRLSEQGLTAIEAGLGPEKFEKFWDTCSKTGGGGLKALDAETGEEKEDKTAPPPTGSKGPSVREELVSRGGKTIGIARGEMRKLFMEDCEDSIRWDHNVVGYEVTPAGVKALFSDGSKSEEGEMLIGGEGIYSKVSRQLTKGELKTYDTGARGIHGQAPTTAFKGLGEGVWRVVDKSDPKGDAFLITNVRPGEMDDPNVIFGWTLGAQPGVIQPPNDDYTIVGKQAADVAKKVAKNWHPRIKSLVDDMIVEDAAFWKITCSSPWGVPEWDNEPRVTIIGDAAHSMTPAGGIGANTAVRDAALLGKLLADAGGYSEEITASYEKEMRGYASEAVAYSYSMAQTQFGINLTKDSPTV